jgi:protein-L-isoaspartate(D-aspartate) O-methyltransferase
MVSFELQRKNMVESQVRPSDITDRRVIRAMLDVPREAFAPQAVRDTAYMDQDLAVTPATAKPRRVLLAPRLFARMAQQLELGDRCAVLEIGTATGYGAAVLSRVARSIVALECDAELARFAATALTAPADTASNIKVVTGPLAAGWPAEGPYDAILVSGTVTGIPPALLDQLKDGGRLVAVVADAGINRLTQWKRLGSTFDDRTIGEAAAPMLPGFEREPAFEF